MKSQINYTIKYILYHFFAKHKKGHGIHSPFVYNLIKDVFNKKEQSKELDSLIRIYNQLKKDNRQIEFKDFGAGSKITDNKQLTLGRIVKRSSVTKKYGQLLFNLVRYFKSSDILEIGTSIGISAAYIGIAAPESHFTTIEGSDSKSKIAKQISDKLELKNLCFINGDFNDVLETVLLDFNKLDFVFFDGNHKKEPTLNYFNLCLNKVHTNSVFVFDDIHWSKEMNQAWEEIKRNKKVRVSIDLFRMGIVFFNNELSYQQYVIKF